MRTAHEWRTVHMQIVLDGRKLYENNALSMAMRKLLLRVARAEKDISQIDLAIRAGVSQRKVWALEHGYREATPEEQEALARALDLPRAAIAWPAVPKREQGVA